MPCSDHLGCGEARFTPPFSRTVAVERVPADGLKGRAEADENERAALAALYGAEEIRRLVFDYEIRPKGKGRFQLKGQMEGELVQACVITLEPVEETVSEAIDLEFWRPEEIDEPRMAVAQSGGQELEGAGPPEPLHNGVINVGAVAAEFLASSMNPYPRKAGAEFHWSDEAGADDEQPATGAFAALKRLKLPK
jgi:hypothetical protein